MQQGHPRWRHIDKALREDAIRQIIKWLSVQYQLGERYASKNM